MHKDPNKRSGVTSMEMIFWIVGAVATSIAYVHSEFATHREVDHVDIRLDRIENKLDSVLEKK